MIDPLNETYSLTSYQLWLNVINQTKPNDCFCSCVNQKTIRQIMELEIRRRKQTSFSFQIMLFGFCSHWSCVFSILFKTAFRLIFVSVLYILYIWYNQRQKQTTISEFYWWKLLLNYPFLTYIFVVQIKTKTKTNKQKKLIKLSPHSH